MLNKTYLFCCLLCLVYEIHSQPFVLFTINITNSEGYPMVSKFAEIHNEKEEIAWTISDANGNFSFIIKNVSFRKDSVYITLEENETDNIKFLLNSIQLFETTKIGDINTYLTEYLFFNSYDEYRKYYNDKVMPPRKKTLARDVKCKCHHKE